MGRLAIGACILAVLSASAGAPAADRFNVDFTVGWGRCYRPMEWTPVEIEIGGGLEKPFGGLLTVTAQQDELTDMKLVHPFVLTPGLRLNVPLVMKLTFAADRCSVSIADEKGRACWQADYELWDYSAASTRLTAVEKDDILIGLIGRGGLGLTRLNKNTYSETSLLSGEVHIGAKLERKAPWDWTGFASLDLLVLYDPDWDMLNRHQAAAIAQWVSNGGRLLVVLGSNPLPPGHQIAAMLPFEPGKAREISLDRRLLAKWQLDPAAGRVTARPLKPKPSAILSETHSYGGGETLFATSFVGFGRVGVLAFDPGGLKADSALQGAEFWVEHIGAVLGREPGNLENRAIRSSETVHTGDADSYGYEQGMANRGLSNIFEHLLQVPELRPLSIWWVILLLFTLTVLLSPVDYFVLKRLDRQPLTWITSAACIILVTIGAYYGVGALRGGSAQVRAVSVIDGVQGAEGCWATTYMGIFAPESDEYALQGLQRGQWWSGISPSSRHLFAYDSTPSMRTITCLQQDGSNLAPSVEISIWSMQCLMSESPAREMPFSAKVKRDGDRLTVSITNHSDCPIAGGHVRLAGDRIMTFDNVPAGGTRRFEGTAVIGPDLQECLSEVVDDWGYEGHVSVNLNSAYLARGCLARTYTVAEYLERGAAVVCVGYPRSKMPFPLAGRRSANDHVQLARMVVFPEQDQTR